MRSVRGRPLTSFNEVFKPPEIASNDGASKISHREENINPNLLFDYDGDLSVRTPLEEANRIEMHHDMIQIREEREQPLGTSQEDTHDWLKCGLYN